MTLRILLTKPDSRLATIRRLDRFLRLEPLELEFLAGAAPGHDVEILDLGLRRFPTLAFDRALRRFKPDLIGLTAYTHQSRRALELAARARAACPAALIVIGGHHATLTPEDFNRSCIDYVVRGEGCRPFSALLARLGAGRPWDKAINDIPGLWPAGPAFDGRRGEPIPPYTPLAELPEPRRDLVDRSRYFSVWSRPDFDVRRGDTLFPRVASMRTSIGCAFHCKFCVVPHIMGGRYLQLTPEETVDTIARLPERHVYLVDDESFLNVGRMRRVAELLRERGVDKRFVGWARSQTVVEHPDLFALWREVGLEIVYIGFEAAADSILKDVEKGSTVATNREAQRILGELGVTTHAAFMAASEWTEADFDLLERHVDEMPPAEITFTIYTPSPGTPNWEAEKERFAADPVALHDCMHALFPTALPLRRFYERFARLSARAERRNPLRIHRCLISPREIVRIVWAGFLYRRALRGAWRDHRPAK